MKKLIVLSIFIILLLTIFSCSTFPVGTSNNIVVEIVSEVWAYRDYDTIEKLRYNELFLIYFELGKLTERDGLINVKIDMSIIYPDGTQLQDTIIQGRFKALVLDEMYIALPLQVPSDIPTGKYTIVVDVYDLYIGVHRSGRDTFKIIGYPIL